MPNTKECVMCKESKNLNEFSKNHSECKQCTFLVKVFQNIQNNQNSVQEQKSAMELEKELKIKNKRIRELESQVKKMQSLYFAHKKTILKLMVEYNRKCKTGFECYLKDLTKIYKRDNIMQEVESNETDETAV